MFSSIYLTLNVFLLDAILEYIQRAQATTGLVGTKSPQPPQALLTPQASPPQPVQVSSLQPQASSLQPQASPPQAPAQASLPPPPPPARPQEATQQLPQQPQQQQQQQQPQVAAFQQNILTQQQPSINVRPLPLIPSFTQQQQQNFQTDPNGISNQIGKVNKIFFLEKNKYLR